MSARAKVAEPIMAMPMNAACKAREVRDVVILNSSIVFGRRKAACVYPRGLGTAQQQPALEAPIRPEFEEDAREADGPDHRARNHPAGPRHLSRPRATDGRRSTTGR